MGFKIYQPGVWWRGETPETSFRRKAAIIFYSHIARVAQRINLALTVVFQRGQEATSVDSYCVADHDVVEERYLPLSSRQY